MYFFPQEKYFERIKKTVTRLSHSYEVMKKVLNGQALTEMEKRKIGLRLRRYKMEIRSSYSGEILEEYLNDVDKFFHLLNTDTTLLTWEWFLIVWYVLYARHSRLQVTKRNLAPLN